jgi:hypothetical protein
MIKVVVFVKGANSTINFAGQYSWSVDNGMIEFTSDEEDETDYFFNQDEVVYFTVTG